MTSEAMRLAALPAPADVPPQAAFTGAANAANHAAHAVYRAAGLQNRLIAPTEWSLRIIAAVQLRHAARALLHEAEALERLLADLQKAEREALEAGGAAEAGAPAAIADPTAAYTPPARVRRP